MFYELWRGLTYRDARRQVADLLIAAFTRRLRATLVTNNTTDFAELGVPVIDWTVDQPVG